MEVGLASALLGAGLGVLGTYVFDVRKAQAARAEREAEDRRERARQRAAVATALLQDLRELELLFHQLYESEEVARAAIARPQFYFDALQAETRWFRPESIYPLAEVFRLAGQYFSTFAQLRASGDGYIVATPQRVYELRANAGFILRQIPAAYAALVREGGLVDDAVPEMVPATYPTLPTVPEPSFRHTQVQIDAVKKLKAPSDA